MNGGIAKMVYMNIYLDIDGVLLINEAHASPYAEEFICSILAKYPNSTYWLTTHCWKGVNRTSEVLSQAINKSTLSLLRTHVRPTEWGEAKTDAIDFTRPFLWFDDDLFEDERQVLVENNALSSWIEVNLSNNPDHLKELKSHLDK